MVTELNVVDEGSKGARQADFGTEIDTADGASGASNDLVPQ